MSPAHVVEAVGGLLWRPASDGPGVDVALVHRRESDDWSLPEGELLEGEHALRAAIRVVCGKTGHVGVPGRLLGEVPRTEDGRSLRVRYRALRLDGGSFVPSDDVDELAWMSPRRCRRLLRREGDRAVVAELARDPEPTWPLVIVRHASAGQPPPGHGPEPERALDPLGYAQAQALIAPLDALGVRRVLSANVVRCVDTVGPYAGDRHIPVELEPLVSETGFVGHAAEALERLIALMERREPVAVCSQGGVIPTLVPLLCRSLGQAPPDEATTDKGGLRILHLTRRGRVRLSAIEAFAAPTVAVGSSVASVAASGVS